MFCAVLLLQRLAPETPAAADVPFPLEHDEDTPVEQRAITGRGPTGPRWGVGRIFTASQPLSLRDERRLIFHVYHAIRRELP